MKNFNFTKTITLLIFTGIILLFSFKSYAMYNGSPNWHPPKKLICKGIPTFPGGIKVLTYPGQVFGMSLDSYVFCELEGAIGIFYFTLGLQEPKDSNILKGHVVHLKTSDWEKAEYEVTCIVKEWHF